MQPENFITPPSTPANNMVEPAVQTPLIPQQGYASVGNRFVAALLDGLILSIFSFAFSFIGGMLSAGINLRAADEIIVIAINLISYILQILYPIYFIGSRGQTPGKYIMKIKVVKADTGETPGYASAFVRETVGKLISSIVLGIGYLVAFRDPKKQAWHDKIANTVVVRV